MSNWEGGQVPAEDTNAGLGTYGEYCRNPVDRVNVAEVSDDERFAHFSTEKIRRSCSASAHEEGGNHHCTKYAQASHCVNPGKTAIILGSHLNSASSPSNPSLPISLKISSLSLFLFLFGV